MGAPPSIAEAIDLAAKELIRIWHDPRMEPEKPTMAVLSSCWGEDESEFALSIALISKPNMTLNISVTVSSAWRTFVGEKRSSVR